MNLKKLLTPILISLSLSLSAQSQNWQWVKAGGSSTDDETNEQPAECKISGCDAKGNVYGIGLINGENVIFDTFSCSGRYAYLANSPYKGQEILLFSYDCSGNMRWARHIGDQLDKSGSLYGTATDVYGNTYIARTFYYGYYGGCNALTVYLGDSVITSVPPSICQSYLCLIKYDSLGNLVWFKNLENDTVAHTFTQTFAYGLRIGSSGNLWMTCNLDSNYAISPNLITTKTGRYNVKLDPNTGNILSGYYIAQETIFGNSDDADTYHDLDENENYYETGTLINFGTSEDTLILASQIVTPSQTSVRPYIFSLDKQGNFRYIITNRSYCTNGSFSSCKYDFQSGRLVTCWIVNSGDIYGNDTFNFNPSNMYMGNTATKGLLAIDTAGNILWGKYVTYSNSPHLGFFIYAPTAFYTGHVISNGLIIYNNIDTLFNTSTTTSSSDYTTVISLINQNGNLTATHSADVGVTGNFTGYNIPKYGATDWRGNVYLGGTVTNFFATPADSVVNTDHTSGNFFIAKLGISDCSCPLPGVHFTETSHGDTVYFSGSSINHSDSIHWRLGDGSVSSSDTFTHVYARDSSYSVTAIAYSGCGIDSITRQIRVTSCVIPAVQFSQIAKGDTVFFYGTSSNSLDSIRWLLGDGTTFTGDTFSHVYASHDSTYTITAIAFSACGSDSLARQITVTSVGIKTIETNATNLYPNPAINSVNLEVSGPATIGLVLANGSSVWQTPVQVSQQGTYVFDMSRYASGLYYFIVQYANGKTDVLQVVKK